MGRVMGTLLTSTKPLGWAKDMLQVSQSYIWYKKLFVYQWTSTKHLVKQVYIKLFKHIMFAHDYKAAVFKLYGLDDVGHCKHGPYSYALKGGAPVPKQTRCPADQRWSADSICPYIVNGKVDNSTSGKSAFANRLDIGLIRQNIINSTVVTLPDNLQGYHIK